MTFDKILLFIKQGKRVERKQWGGFAIKSDGRHFVIDEYMFKNITHDDIFADDWFVKEEN